MAYQQERIREALHHAAAEFLSREAGRQSLITVTGVRLNESGKSAEILMTVFPEEQEGPALAFANRKRFEFVEFFKSRVKGALPPRVEFLIDRGEKNRQRLDEL